MKKILLITVTALLAHSLYISAGIENALNCFSLTSPYVKTIPYEWTKNNEPVKAGKTNVGFSISNKAKAGKQTFSPTGTLFFSLENSSIGRPDLTEKFLRFVGGKIYVRRLPAGQIADIELNTSNDTKLTIYRCNSLDTCNPNDKKNIAFSYTFPKNKTIYVTWNPDEPKDHNRLYPQTGPVPTWIRNLIKYDPNITDRCFSKLQNVTQADIKETAKK